MLVNLPFYENKQYSSTINCANHSVWIVPVSLPPARPQGAGVLLSDDGRTHLGYIWQRWSETLFGGLFKNEL